MKPNPCCQRFTVRHEAGTYNGIPRLESWCVACGRSAVPEGKVLVIGKGAHVAAKKLALDFSKKRKP